MEKSEKVINFENFLVSIGGLVDGNYRNKPNITTNICSCKDGWLPLIQELIEKLIAAGWNKEICCIKEKFGALRFYINEGNEEIFKLIGEYETKSSRMCDICGEPGDLRKGSWLTTRCDAHAPEGSEKMDRSFFIKYKYAEISNSKT